MSLKKKLSTYTLIFTGSSIAVHFLNRFIFFSATLDNLIKQENGDYYKWRFGNIYYEKTGNGAPILLIHDLSAYSSSYEWYKLKNELSKTNTVYTLDLLGCGRSHKPNLTYTNFLYVQLITDFIKHIIGKKTDIIVTGESAPFALMACINTNTMIDKIILINPVSLIQLAKIPTKRTKFIQKIITTPIIGTLLYNIVINRRKLIELFRTKYYYDSAKISERDINTYFESAHIGNTNSKYLFASIISRYTNLNILFCLKNIKNSIFILAGDGNPENSTIAEIYQNQLPAIEIIKMKNTKHLPQLELPQKILQEIKLLFDIQESTEG